MKEFKKEYCVRCERDLNTLAYVFLAGNKICTDCDAELRKTVKAERTPGPWKYLDGAILSEKINSFGNWIVINTLQRNEEDQANAAFIVRACNSYDALIAALEESIEYIKRVSSETVGANCHDYADYDLLERIESALRDAGEKV